MYQALYRKYRPAVFSDVVGQEHITEILKNELKSGKIFHAYLFTGPRGTGKTSCAKILAKAVNCLSPKDGDACLECESCKAIENGDVLDITEIDAASNNGVENIRDLKEQVSYTPTSCKYRVYIIDEVHMLSIGAFNALLKTLEEPPAHVVFILATTEVHKLPATILSRCQRFDFHRIPPEAIGDRLMYVAEKEGFGLERQAADLIAALSDGGMRDALSTLDLCAARTRNITSEDVLQVCSLAGSNYCIELAGHIKKNDTGAALCKIDELHKNAVDLQRLCGELIAHYRSLMIARTVKDPGTLIVTAPKTLEEIKSQAEDYPLESIIYAINVLTAALDRMTSSDRRTELEMAVVRLCLPQLDNSSDALLARLERIERQIKYGAVKVPSAEETAARECEEQKRGEGTDEPPICEPQTEANGSEAVADKKETRPAKSTGDLSASSEPFDAWQDVMSELNAASPLLAGALNGSKAYVNGDVLLIDSSNDQFFSMMKADPIFRDQIRNAVNNVVGRTYRLGPYRKPAPKTEDPLQNIINKLKQFEVPEN